MSRILSSSLSHRGRKRANNEDFIASFEPTDPTEQEASGSLYVVADGVGGAALGERASQYAAEKVLYEYYLQADIEVSERLRQIFEQVNKEIYSFADQSSQITRMGTTLVAAAIRGDILTVANVGDSRAYLIREGVVTQITRDHNLIGELVNNDSMTEAEALKSKVKNRLTRALGSENEIHVDIFSSIQIQPGDMVLLCTDGLTRYALREDISSLTQDGTPEAITNDLVHFANQHGGADNVSVILIAFEPTMGEWPVAKFQKTPEPVSWDTMQTQPWVPAIRRRRLPAPLFWGLMGLGAVVVIGALTLGFPRVANPVPLATPTLNLPIALSSPTEFIYLTATTTPTLALLLRGTLTSDPSQEPGLTINCQYTVQAGDTMDSILEKFWTTTSYTGVSCAQIIPGNETCDYNPEQPGSIGTGWILIIQNVLPTNCQNYGGIPAP